VTESVVALPNGSAIGGSDSPRASARVRVNRSVTERVRARPAGGARVVRRALRVMYVDAADSWIVRESTPSIRQVWRTDYAALAVDHPAARVWCRVYRFPAVASAAVLDSIKWCAIHPVRGPLLAAASAGTVWAVIGG